MSQAGIKRLDDDSLLALAAIRLKLLMQADTAGCAALARGQPGSNLQPMLGKLSDEDVNQYFELTYQAMTAELNQSPAARQADVGQLKRILNTMVTGLPQAGQPRLMADLKNLAAAGDDEVCWTERTLQTEASKLSRRDQIQWLLAQAAE